MKNLSLALAIALSAAGCSAPATTPAVEAPHTFSFTTSVSFDTALGRQLLDAGAQAVTKITGANVHHVDVYMKPGALPAALTTADLDNAANGWAKATVANLQYRQAQGVSTGASLNFGNLSYGSSYVIVAVAKGDNPNTATVSDDEVLVNENLALSAASLDVPGPVNGSYKQSLDPTTDKVLFPYDASGVKAPGWIKALPSKLADVAFSGYADGVGVRVTDGTVTAPTAPATLKADPMATLKLASDSRTTDRMGFWNYLAVQTASNGNDGGNDFHLQLGLYNLPASAILNKITFTDAGGNVSNTVGYVSDWAPDNALNRQFLGVYANEVYQYHGGPTPAIGADGTLKLDLYLEAQGPNPTPDSVVTVDLETSQGNFHFENRL